MKSIAVLVGAAFVLAGILTFAGLYFPMNAFIKNEVEDSLEDAALAVVEKTPQFLNIAAISKIWDEGRYWEEIHAVEDIALAHSVEDIYFLDTNTQPWVFLWALIGFERERFPEGEDWRSHLYYYDKPGQVPDDLRRAVSLRTHIISSKPYSTEWGTFVSLFEPVMDESGKMTGVIGIDKEVSRIEEILQRLLVMTLLPLAGFSLVGIVVAVFVQRRITALLGTRSS
jgi:hypothetical protein